MHKWGGLRPAHNQSMDLAGETSGFANALRIYGAVLPMISGGLKGAPHPLSVGAVHGKAINIEALHDLRV